MSDEQTINEIKNRHDEAVQALKITIDFGRKQKGVLDTAIANIEDHQDAVAGNITKATSAKVDAIRKERDDLISSIQILENVRLQIGFEASFDIFSSAEMQAALKAMSGIVTGMNTVAARMLTVAQFIKNASILVNTATEVETALKKQTP